MKRAILFLGMAAGAIAAGGCVGAGYRMELVGQADVTARAPAVKTAPLHAEVPVKAAQELHILSWNLWLPSAMELHWRVACPGVERNGVQGETFERYKQRRLAQLERERQEQAGFVGGVVGAVVPRVAGGAAVRTPSGTATATGAVDPGAAAADATYGATAQPELPPGDVGAQVVSGRVEVATNAPGSCTIDWWSEVDGQDATGVRATVVMNEQIDVQAERDAAAAAARRESEKGAKGIRVDVLGGLTARGAVVRTPREQHRVVVHVRGEVIGDLTARGADPQGPAKQRAAREEERRRRAQAEWEAGEPGRRRAAEEQATRDRERREREAREWAIVREGTTLRGGLLVDLRGWGADPTLRAREQEEQRRRYEEEERAREEARRQAEEEVRLEWQASLETRASMKGDLVAYGAIERQPHPAPPVEDPGTPPAPGAVWIGGNYAWGADGWIWIAGQWRRPPTVDVVWVAPVEVQVRGVIVVQPGRWVRPRNAPPHGGPRYTRPAPPTTPTNTPGGTITRDHTR